MRFFSLREANSLLPFLRERLTQIELARREIRQLVPEIRNAQERAHLGGGSYSGPSFVRHLIRLLEMVREIESTGVIVKDYDLGLCDFPYRRDGKVVFLCWKRDEKRILWWHDTDAGFAGRQMLD